jgi:two-component system CheB/CheR fusion protein
MQVDDTPNTSDLTIIGLGSSAGGLEAVRDFVGSLPTDLNVTYVVVQHMSPHHKSLMTELVARETKLKVRDVVDGLVPVANEIYITPPNSDVLLKDGALRLVDPSPQLASPKPSVDRFLLSLADEWGEKSVAIILSGTGSDGAYGVQAIRAAGGITIAQNSESAKYDGMPSSAVQTGCVDLILPPYEIGTYLTNILSSPRDFGELRRGEFEQTPLSDLLQILLARTRVDFREYKQTTISRRIERRMLALGIQSKEEYTQFCRTNPQAVDALYKDLLISVTRFFRDKQEFEDLNSKIPELIASKNGGPLRVWLAGCATGEEAYSIAMLLSEALGGPDVVLKNHVQIFATDIDEEALLVARRGVYGFAALNDIPSDLADKYLMRENDHVRVIDNLRRAILFSHHNVCQDPPFQRIDLVCCRNLLIYFGNNLQQKVMNRFHYSMSANSWLLLGTAESVAGSDELFVQDIGAARLFRKRQIHAHSLNRSAVHKRLTGGAQVSTALARPTSGTAQSTDGKMFEALAFGLGKNSMLVRDDYTIVKIFGNVSGFIDINENSTLKMSLDLLRSPLREEARSLISLSLKNKEQRRGVRHLIAKDDPEEVMLEVFPIVADSINERAALIVFKTVDRTQSVSKSVKPPTTGDTATLEWIRSLEDEVSNTREALQQTIEELETSNEELQSLNEELQSTNEELQATNEELETSNEELQSTNEELITVNEELQVTTSELSGRTGELASILDSAPLVILVLDSALQITQATSAAAALFGLETPITNPHVSQCKMPDGYPALAPICIETLKLGETKEVEFSSGEESIKLSTSPYFDNRGAIRGVTVVISAFQAITA